MNIKTRLEKIKKKLNINKNQDYYVICLWVDKEKSFEESNRNYEKTYPLFVIKDLKEKYLKVQNEIKNDPKAGGVLLLDLLKKQK